MCGLASKIKPTQMTYKTSSGEIRRAEGKVRVHIRIERLRIASTMLVMPYGCSYNILLANDIVGPMTGDILRSERLVRFFWGGQVILTPLLHETSIDEIRAMESYFLLSTKLASLSAGVSLGVVRTSMSHRNSSCLMVKKTSSRSSPELRVLQG